MTIEESINELTTETTSLLDVCSTIKDDVALSISNAVIESENETIVPLFQLTTNAVTTNTLLINLINK